MSSDDDDDKVWFGLGSRGHTHMAARGSGLYGDYHRKVFRSSIKIKISRMHPGTQQSIAFVVKALQLLGRKGAWPGLEFFMAYFTRTEE